jgi:hypothetical protein
LPTPSSPPVSSEVEQVLAGHPAVYECAVIGVPDPDWGETVKAVVVLNPGREAEADDLISWCRTELGGVKTPKSIDFAEDLPRSPRGKVLKRVLRDHYWAGRDSLGAFADGVAADPYWSGTIDKPAMVAVNGMAIGAGFDQVLRADLRITADTAVFRMPEVDIGNFMLLWENLPFAIGAEILVGTGFSAERAHQVGLINRIAPAADLMDHALAWADELLSKPSLVLRQSLKLLRSIRNANAAPDQARLRAASTDASRVLAATEDGQEAVSALLARRRPGFRAR